MEIKVRTGQFQDITRNTRRNKWAIWWRLIRPHTLTASFIPVAIGTAFALRYSNIKLFLFLDMLLASILLQAATNMFNEYYDYRQGLDNEHSVGIGGTIVRDGIEAKTVLTIAQCTLAAAFFLGFYLCLNVSWWLLPVGLIGAAVGYFYSGGPYPISATPFGEIISGIFMGLTIICVAFFIQAGSVPYEVILVSIPTSILIGSILLANNLRDLDGDKLNGRKTLAILLGRRSGTALLQFMFAFAYLCVVSLIVTGIVSSWALLAFFSLPKAVTAISQFRRNSTPEAMMSAMVATAQTNTLFGLFLTLGLILQYLIG